MSEQEISQLKRHIRTCYEQAEAASRQYQQQLNVQVDLLIRLVGEEVAMTFLWKMLEGDLDLEEEEEKKEGEEANDAKH